MSTPLWRRMAYPIATWKLSRGALDVIASASDLVNERLHVRCNAICHQVLTSKVFAAACFDDDRSIYLAIPI